MRKNKKSWHFRDSTNRRNSIGSDTLICADGTFEFPCQYIVSRQWPQPSRDSKRCSSRIKRRTPLGSLLRATIISVEHRIDPQTRSGPHRWQSRQRSKHGSATGPAPTQHAISNAPTRDSGPGPRSPALPGNRNTAGRGRLVSGNRGLSALSCHRVKRGHAVLGRRMGRE